MDSNLLFRLINAYGTSYSDPPGFGHLSDLGANLLYLTFDLRPCSVLGIDLQSDSSKKSTDRVKTILSNVMSLAAPRKSSWIPFQAAVIVYKVVISIIILV